MYTKIWTENLREADYLGCGRKDAIKIDFIEIIWKVLFCVCLPKYSAMMSMCDHSNELLLTYGGEPF
jgi:hypothetical protein